MGGDEGRKGDWRVEGQARNGERGRKRGRGVGEREGTRRVASVGREGGPG